jgi:RNA polymerase sigma-70 factor, ECF subfamily
MRMLDSADAVLVKSTLAGDESAFAELVRRYQAAVWGRVHRTLGNSTEGEDAVQEIFLRAFSSLSSFNPDYPFGPWVLRIATNYCIDQLRRKKTRKYKLWTELTEGEQERLLNSMSCEGNFDSIAAEAPEKYQQLAQSLLDKLKPKHRMAFVLREVEGRSYEEVARALGTSELAARVRVSRARADIQKRFRKHLAGSMMRERQ